MEAAPGRLGQSSPEAFEYVLKYKGKSTRNEDYENFVIKANNDGSMLRLKDVARVEFGSFTYSSNSRMDGKPVSGFGVFQTAGSNANDILTKVEKLLDKFSAELPRGVEDTTTMYNSKDFLDASIQSQVTETLLILAFGLVFLKSGVFYSCRIFVPRQYRRLLFRLP